MRKSPVPRKSDEYRRSAGNERHIYDLVARGIVRVDDHGRLWRVGRFVYNGRGKSRFAIFGYPEPFGTRVVDRRSNVPRIIIYRMMDSAMVRTTAERLVWLHFFGPIANGHDVYHRDLNNLNNDPDNLLCGPTGKRMRYEYGAGLYSSVQTGESNGRAKITAAMVREIRALYEQRNPDGSRMNTQKDIAKRFGLCDSNVSQIVLGKIWKTVKSNANEALPPSS